jgi:RDD family
MGIAYEGVILFGVVFFFGYGFSALTRFKGQPGPLRWAFQAFLLIVLAAYFGYFWSAGRRTLPMKTLSLELVGPADGPAGIGRALARCLVAIGLVAAALAGAAYVGPLWGLAALVPLAWVFIDRDRRALYDVLCGTRLVVAPPVAATVRRPAG